MKQERGVGLTRSRPADLRSPSAAAESRATAAVEPRPSTLMSADQQTGGLQSYALAERHKLLRFLAARGAGDEAEDLLHELWQRIGAGSAQPVADPMAYLFRAAENLIRDMRRSRMSREKRQFDWHETASAPEEQPLGERVLIARERLRAVEEELEKLGPRVAAVFRAYRIEGIGQAEIARDHGVSLSSVEKDLQKAYRAIASLRQKMDLE